AKILHQCPRLPGQTFDDLLFEEDILAFHRFLGHSGEIRKLTDGLYNKKNVYFAYLLWEDFVYQVEHKDAKKSNEMYYPRFTKVIIHYFMTKDPSIPRRNKVNWHYVRDDQMYTTIKLVSRHQNTQQFNVMLPIELTNKEIRNSEAYKEYYVVASGAAPPKTKASVRKTKSSSDTTVTPPTAAAGTRLSTFAKGKQPAKSSKAKNEGTGIIPGVPDVPTKESNEEISWKSSDEDDDYVYEESDDQDDDDDQDEGDDNDDQDEVNDDDQDTDEEGEEFIYPKLSIHDEEETKDEESFDPIAKTPKNSDDEGNDDENLCLNVGSEEGHDVEDDEDELYRDVNINLEGRVVQMADVHTTQEFEDTHVTLTPINPDGQQQSSTTSTNSYNNCSEHSSARSSNFSEFVQTNQFTGAVSSIFRIVQRYMDQYMNEAVKIIKEQVKEHVKVQVSKILPKIEKTMNEQLEAEVLTWSSNSSKTSYDVTADLSKMELNKILIEKMESNKSIHRSNEQRNLYKALVEAYEFDKIILDTYGDVVILKRHRDDDADKDKESSAGSDRGSKRRKEGKEPKSTSALKEKASKTTGNSTQGFKSQQKTASESALAEEPMQTTHDLQQKKPLTPDRDWNKTLPATHGSIQLWISELAKQDDSRSSFNELMDTPVDFTSFLMNRLKVDTLTLELLAGPTYELMKGLCKSLVELKFFLEEVYKATTYQLDWNNLEEQESARDVYSKCRIIAITKLKIVEWHNYKHLDWIKVRRDDDKLYKFKEGDFKRLRIQDIKDMLPLLVQ
nr:hypothetical protein [Tanacetum cinerariifolium]